MTEDYFAPYEIQATFENRPVTVAAIDPEVVETAQVCIIEDTVDGIGRNVTRLSVPRTAQATATKLCLKEPQRLKATERIGDVENTITPLTLASGTDFTWALYSQALVAHIRSSLVVFANLRTFYSSKKMKAMAWDRKRASKAEMSRAVGSVAYSLVQ
ncbi:hypothetical protein BGZ72_005795 [Mortierella alpina]|nr:hypothetical protein BGZ72_005795 [Mortierella alpina]